MNPPKPAPKESKPLPASAKKQLLAALGSKKK